MFSERTRYIVKLLLFLGKDDLDIYRTVDDLSDETGIPGPYLGKLVGFLADNGYLETRKGPSGGVSLAKPPNEIKMDDVFRDAGEYKHSDNLDDTCCMKDLFKDCYVEKTINSFREEVVKGDSLSDVLQKMETRN